MIRQGKKVRYNAIHQSRNKERSSSRRCIAEEREGKWDTYISANHVCPDESGKEVTYITWAMCHMSAQYVCKRQDKDGRASSRSKAILWPILFPSPLFRSHDNGSHKTGTMARNDEERCLVDTGQGANLCELPDVYIRIRGKRSSSPLRLRFTTPLRDLHNAHSARLSLFQSFYRQSARYRFLAKRRMYRTLCWTFTEARCELWCRNISSETIRSPKKLLKLIGEQLG